MNPLGNGIIGPSPWKTSQHKIRTCFYPIPKILLAYKADTNVGNRNGDTPLYIAATRGHLEIVKLLLTKGGNPNAKDRYGKTPLSFYAK